MDEQTKTEMFVAAIDDAEVWVMAQFEDADAATLATARRMAGDMADQLVDQLEHLASGVLTDEAWVAGFVSGCFSAVRLLADEDIAIGHGECDHGANHLHLVHDAELVASYLNVAVKGVIDAYHMFRSIGDISAELEG